MAHFKPQKAAATAQNPQNMKTAIQFFKWLGSAIEDKRGSISSKRIGFFIAIWYLKGLLETPAVEIQLVWALISLIAGLAGIALAEWFTKLKQENNETTN